MPRLTQWSKDVSSQVHDLWFDADALSAWAGEPVIDVPLHLRTSERTERLLRFTNVSSIEIRDAERVGRYDINCIEIDEFGHVAIIHGNIPIRIIVRGFPHLGIEIIGQNER